MRKQYLECGKIVSTHGVRGEVKVEPWCDSPEYLCTFPTLYFDKNGKLPVKVERARTNKHMALLKLEGADSIDGASALRGKVLYLNRDDDPDPQSVFLQDFIGLMVYNADTGREYGRLTDVLETGANDVYQIQGEAGTQRLVPAIDQVILSVDWEAGKMEIRPLKGLFDDED